MQRHRTELMHTNVGGCLSYTWGAQLCARGSTLLTVSSSVKKTKQVCVVGEWEVPLLRGQLLKVLHLQGCSVALEDADGVWAPFCRHAGSGAGLHCAASHCESLVFGLTNAGHQQAFQVGSGSW